jgi:hypothetical protein
MDDGVQKEKGTGQLATALWRQPSQNKVRAKSHVAKIYTMDLLHCSWLQLIPVDIELPASCSENLRKL